jgi:peptidoglycan hydrolase-like protein with peptidoglycan-binding domain/DNA invertase Pin-like site-specific DNA recombinase
MLTSLGYDCGPVDGLYGPRTRAGVRSFQVRHGLRPTGIAAPGTLTRLGRGAAAVRRMPAGARPAHLGEGYASPGGSPQVRAIQVMLLSLGYRSGPVDGLYGPRTRASVEWFQIKHALRPTGAVDLATLMELSLRSSGTTAERPGAAPASPPPAARPAPGTQPAPQPAPASPPPAARPAPGTQPAPQPAQASPPPAVRPAPGMQPAPQAAQQPAQPPSERAKATRPVPLPLLLAAAAVIGLALLAAIWRPLRRASGAARRRALRIRSALGRVRERRPTLGIRSALGRVRDRRPALGIGAALGRARDRRPTLGIRSALGRLRERRHALGIRSAIGRIGAFLTAAAARPLGWSRRAAGGAWRLVLRRRRTPVGARTAPRAAPPAGAQAAQQPSLTPSTVRLLGPPPAPAQRLPDRSLAIGYATSSNKAELDRQAAAIARTCSQRGWTLSDLVREGATDEPIPLRRPGLGHVLKQLSGRSAARLVVTSLEHVARSPAELARLLVLCAKVGADLIALDVGLDTGTREGRLAARCLVAAGRDGRDGHAARARPSPERGAASERRRGSRRRFMRWRVRAAPDEAPAR